MGFLAQSAWKDCLLNAVFIVNGGYFGPRPHLRLAAQHGKLISRACECAFLPENVQHPAVENGIQVAPY